MNKADKIKRFFSKELSKDIQSIMLLEASDGTYLAFGKYSILPIKDCYEVLTIKEPWRTNPVFSNLKIALAWCVYDKYCMVKEANRLPHIDTELSGIQINLAVLQQKLKKTSSTEDKFIYLAKMQESKYKKAQILKELNHHIGITSLWQKEKLNKFDPTYS
jgi:hypothetical protein